MCGYKMYKILICDPLKVIIIEVALWLHAHNTLMAVEYSSQDKIYLGIWSVLLQLAHQAKGSQEEYGAVVDKQFSLETSYKELSTQLDQRRQENKKLVKELEKESKVVCERKKEVVQLQAQLTQQENKHKQLVEKVCSTVAVMCG